jgi:hypothetical protein
LFVDWLVAVGLSCLPTFATHLVRLVPHGLRCLLRSTVDCFTLVGYVGLRLFCGWFRSAFPLLILVRSGWVRVRFPRCGWFVGFVVYGCSLFPRFGLVCLRFVVRWFGLLVTSWVTVGWFGWFTLRFGFGWFLVCCWFCCGWCRVLPPVVRSIVSVLSVVVLRYRYVDFTLLLFVRSVRLLVGCSLRYCICVSMPVGSLVYGSSFPLVTFQFMLFGSGWFWFTTFGSGFCRLVLLRSFGSTF